MMIIKIDMEASGKRLKEICDEKGVSVNDLQRELNLKASQTIYKWFSGKSIPSIDNLVGLREVLDVTLDELVVVKKP